MRKADSIVKRYEKLEVKVSLKRSYQYPFACKELAFILRNAYSTSPKNLQALIFQDTLTAFGLLPQMQTQSAVSAANILLQSVDAVLPKQKRILAGKEFKHAIIAHKKRSKAQQGQLGQIQLPEDVLVHIFSFLDVWSLISAAAVCRSWSAAAIDNHLWESLYADFFGKCGLHMKLNHLNIKGEVEVKNNMNSKEALITPSKTDWRDAFRRAYKGRAATKFKSYRGYCGFCNSIFWLRSSGDNCKNHITMPLSTQQIVEYLLKDHVSSNSSSDSDSDDDDDKFLLKLWAYPSQMLPYLLWE